MKKHRRCYTALTVMMALLALTSCTEQNEVKPLFDQSAAQRSAAQAGELRTLLQAGEHGWALNYQPDKKAGVFSFLFKFPPDTSIVVTQSDFSRADLTPFTSSYDIRQGAATQLIFTTKSPLHKLADSGFSPIPNAGGSGLKGSFEFLYQSLADNGEDLIFRAARGLDTLVFRKAPPNYGDILTANLSSLDTLLKAAKGNYFPFAIILAGTEASSPASVLSASRVTINFDARSFSITRVSEDKEGIQTLHPEYIAGFAPIPTGVRLIRLDTQKENEEQPGAHRIHDLDLTWKSANNEYEALLEGGQSIRLGGQYPSDFAQKNFLDYVDGLKEETFLIIDDETTSQNVREQLANLSSIFEAQLRQRSITFSNISYALAFDKSTEAKNRFAIVDINILNQISTLGFYALAFKVDGRRLIIEQSDAYPEIISPSFQLQSQINKVLSLLTDPQGFYVSEQMSLPKKSPLPGILPDTPAKPGYKLISTQNPENQFFFLKP